MEASGSLDVELRKLDGGYVGRVAIDSSAVGRELLDRAREALGQPRCTVTLIVGSRPVLEESTLHSQHVHGVVQCLLGMFITNLMMQNHASVREFQEILKIHDSRGSENFWEF